MSLNLRAGLASLREILLLVHTDTSRFVKIRLFWVLLLVICASVLTGLGPVALKLVVDGFTHQTRGVPVSAVLLISLYVASQWLARSAGEIRGLVYAKAQRRMIRTMAERLFAHVLQLPLRFHLDRQTGAISQTLDNGMQGYQLILQHLVFTVLPVTVELATVILILLRLHHPAFIVLFCGAMICYAAAFSYAAARISAAAKTASTAHIDATATITDSILNYETVKYFAAESLVQARASRALTRTENEWVGFYRRFAWNGLGVAAIFASFLAVAILYAAREVEAQRMTVGDFVLVNTYMLQVVRPVEMLGYAVQGLSQGLAMLEKMLVLFHEIPEPASADGASIAAGPGCLEFEHVSLSYGPDRTVLRDVSLYVPAGKTLGIVGASGAGKSSIVRLLVRLYEPDHGLIRLDGASIAALPLARLREAIAVVPQDSVLFNDTIAYNIGFGKAGSTQAEVERAAQVAHLHDFVQRLPEGYQTRVGERGVKLSGGEKQRVSIARAAIKRPRIYVFDEATSSLDSHTEREILGNLREISRSSTTLVIAHRLSTVVHADEIVVLDGGCVVERGSHSTLLESHGRYAALWEAQASGRGDPPADRAAVQR